MAYAVVAIVLGAVIGLATGGRLENLGEHRLAAWPLLPIGVFAQLVGSRADGTTAVVLLLTSYAALFAFTAANARLLGMALVTLGLALNFLVIAVNSGMPVRPTAVVSAGITDQKGLQDIHLRSKHHYERPSDRLMVLADVIPVRPLREVLSIGDVIMSIGTALVLATLLRRAPAHPQREPSGSLPSER